MRQLTVAVLVALAVVAFAQEGEQVRPRIGLPGEKSVEKQLSITKTQMEAWELTRDDQDALNDKLATLNKARATLLRKLNAARGKVAEATKELRGVLTELEQQEAALYAFVKPRLPEEKKADFDLRVKLQPLIDWLKLSGEQATQLIEARKKLLEEYGGKDETPTAKIAVLASGEITKENRAEYIALVRKYGKFQKDWITKVEGLLDDGQKKLWNRRYLRTAYTIKEGF